MFLCNDTYCYIIFKSEPEGGCGGLNKTIISISLGYLPAHFLCSLKCKLKSARRRIIYYEWSNVRICHTLQLCNLLPPVFDRVGRILSQLNYSDKFRRILSVGRDVMDGGGRDERSSTWMLEWLGL